MAPVYLIASYNITDADRYEQDYVPGVLQTLPAAGGEVIVASGSASVIEGAAPSQTVVLRFPSEEAFRDWYADNASLVQLRLDTTANTTAVLAKEYPEASRQPERVVQGCHKGTSKGTYDGGKP